MSKQEFIEIFNLLKLNFNKEMNDEIMNIWYDQFKDMSKDTFKRCVINCIKEDKIFPTINKLANFSLILW